MGSVLWFIGFVVLGIGSYIVFANANGNSFNGLFDFLSSINNKIEKYRNAPFESHQITSQKDRKQK
ncbi:hypothetical protein [Burkholderia cenocepacia]|uniref:hypothetical protein n=1 Tax=Burkholderia cenocepacia TaxID=95486 RepID=UPI002238ED8B|nr:hypothetical protein [Burkholderia cenocepacia]MCW5156362.1 hypothetical protein [Burkholderia cenocepacia]